MSGDIRVVKGEAEALPDLPDFLQDKSEKFRTNYVLLRSLLETEGVNRILRDFNAMVGVSVAIIDLDANVLASSKWQRLCTDFHRAYPGTCERCIESDTELANELESGAEFTMYGCRNGLVDCASPIIIEGEHVANLFIGQFLIKQPDRSFFEQQANTFGLPVADYMGALDEVPVVDEARIPPIMGFLVHFANLVASMGLEKLRSLQIEETARQSLEIQVEERTAELRQAEERSRLLLESVGEGVFGVDLKGRITFVNPQAEAMLGYRAEELIGELAHPLFHHTRSDGSNYPVHECWMFKSFTFGESYRIDDEVLWRKDGTPYEIEYHSTPVRRGEELVGAVISFIDISLRKEAERQLTNAYGVITGSITYAGRIQRSILPDDSLLAENLADHFVLWIPRDVVGGDMYWCRQWGDGLLILLGDCTGHGVPGAFMTLITNGALRIAEKEVMPGDVADLISRMHQIIQTGLGQHKDTSESDDGLDMGACFIPADKAKLFFVGARFELFVTEKGHVRVVKGTRKGIGYCGISADQKYETVEIDVCDDQTFYMSTDGIVDQIGGERRRSFGKKRFTQLLADIFDQPVADQKASIEQAVLAFQGEESRRDDVSVIGFKVG
ncbi:PocR ligand-binding domain-containing protein [Magnetospira sp. QH-2]|uniref:PocR ligand-binding domain-containing protein n=1 Tax=Magnetospira sp. (strain QH-2) TaxID=1288970 RepID=UPI0003E81C2E|nr:PocR ligand-binding domain-containing protein [Magnetospira sp. QH-2]CCQ74216.1 Protein of unknown function [Magnetospira sp. QH-2]